ncbi:hypothetical protein [Streptomyces sp. NPDC088725]|uniref:hypothetical protein n=1 Tax=Streptomyces sp. NPDC088725 TaxID=3365873 RepID=UPI00380E8800
MLIMEAVVETYDAVDLALWPAAAPSADRRLVLSGRMSPLEVGTDMAVLTDCGQDESDAPAPDGRAGVRRVQNLLSVDLAIAPGGIQLRDTVTDVVVAPPSPNSGLPVTHPRRLPL